MRAAALLTLMRLGGGGAADRVREALRDSSYAVVSSALYALAKVDSAGAEPDLVRYLDMPSHRNVVEIAALWSLARVDTARAQAEAMDRVRPGHPVWMRYASLVQLGRTGRGNPDAAALVAGMINEQDRTLQSTAIRTLGTIGDASMLPRLDAIAADPTHRYRDEAKQAVAAIKARTQATITDASTRRNSMHAADRSQLLRWTSPPSKRSRCARSTRGRSPSTTSRCGLTAAGSTRSSGRTVRGRVRSSRSSRVPFVRPPGEHPDQRPAGRVFIAARGAPPGDRNGPPGTEPRPRASRCREHHARPPPDGAGGREACLSTGIRRMRCAEKVLETLNVRLDVRAPARVLGVAHQQVVEIARAMSYNPHVLLLRTSPPQRSRGAKPTASSPCSETSPPVGSSSSILLTASRKFRRLPIP